MWASRGEEKGGRWRGINRFICLRPSLIILPLPFVPDLMKPKCQVRRGPHIKRCQSWPSAHLKPDAGLLASTQGPSTLAARQASHHSTAKFFSREELHLAADAQEIAQEPILIVDCSRLGVSMKCGGAYRGRGIKGKASCCLVRTRPSLYNWSRQAITWTYCMCLNLPSAPPFCSSLISSPSFTVLYVIRFPSILDILTSSVHRSICSSPTLKPWKQSSWFYPVSHLQF